jgi:hypothetical protein
MLPVHVVSVASGGPWLVRNGADIGFALAATGQLGLVPTMPGNLLYLYGVAILGPGARRRLPLSQPAVFSGVLVGWPGEQLAWYYLGGLAAIFAGLMLGRRAPRPTSMKSEPV